ncbi:MBL fold metallo-hydrolase [Salinarimonas soli]|uniref:MBL fold metallo-hydrolase n=1 Tax=Salinarimonas soli TaxID=1638099 RepID=A0A5B2VVE0_9HYPH|nr:MBL fold metallo-hydrolase [Salinarimonas soli]KAA2242089.1 MBL fold metallo-hydrolase [Salinarimonas soli]
MRLTFHGGFGEKGRTSLAVAGGGVRLLLDAGIDTAATGPARYPAITPAELAGLDALLVTHAHEDHLAALGWCLANRFRGRILMTPETLAERESCLAAYAEPRHRAPAARAPVETFQAGETLAFGDLTVETGRSGHAVGGVWFRVRDVSGASVLYCGDTVPRSPVLAMDPLPPSDVVLFDASYGDDAVPAERRAGDIRAHLAARPGPCLLPVPLLGRPVELLRLLDPPIAIHRLLREPLRAQIADGAWLREGAGADLAWRLDMAHDWSDGEPFPGLPLLVHDAMGLGGPSQEAIPRAVAAGVPILFTGHLPTGSPGALALERGRADWIRLPTHPTWPDNLETLDACGPAWATGHSCPAPVMAALARQRPGVLRTVRVGETLDVAALVRVGA